MKLLTSDQIRKLDKLTIHEEGIESIELMERAAKVYFNEILLGM